MLRYVWLHIMYVHVFLILITTAFALFFFLVGLVSVSWIPFRICVVLPLLSVSAV